MMNYDKLKRNEKVFRWFTGITIKEFEKLIPSFESAWNIYYYETYVKKERKRKVGGGRISGLNKIEDKLVFILSYYKVYPLQFVQGLLFNIDQSGVSRWFYVLSKILTKTLGYEKVLPARNQKNLEDILQECPELQFLLDGTERPIQRPKDKIKQKEKYSGKKKRHMNKNVVIAGKKRKIVFLSKTKEGKMHDKKVLDQENVKFPRDSLGIADSAFGGYENYNLKLIIPKKKPKGRELNDLDKSNNTSIGQARINIEHIIGGVKISRIVADILRNKRKGVEDLVMYISCGLHNFRAQMRNYC